MAKPNIDKFKENIDNYGKNIRTMESYVEFVRSNPGMHLGHKGNKGFLTMIREILDNAIDQLALKESPCDHISLYYNENTNEVSVMDNGLGIPFEDIERVFTKEYTSKNYDKKDGEYSSGMNGVGAKAVNAASSVFIAESYRYDGRAIRLEMRDGKPIGEKKSIPNPNHMQGTKITFVPSIEVMGYMSLPWQDVYNLTKKIMSLTEIGSVLDFQAVDKNNKVFNEHIENVSGILSDLITRVRFPLIKPITIFHDNGLMYLNMSFCYDTGGDKGPRSDESVISYCNFCPTTSGTHVDGCLEGICKWFTQYMNTIYLANQKAKDKLKVNASDIKTGLNIIISAKHKTPLFTGQVKENLDNEDFIPFAKDVVMNGLNEWCKSNPQDLSKLAKYFKDIAELRQKSESAKTKIAIKYQASSLTGLPTKYAKPLGKEHLELIIVEGDSAGGMAKNGRDKQRQGVFPIRGKMPNAFQKSQKEFLENAEVQGIIRILLGRDYFRKFDPIKDCKYEKIIFMADADVDGAHINALLLRFFLLYMPQLIEAGKVYKAVPPLYSIGTGKKCRYFTEQIDIIHYVEKFFTKNNKISKLDGTPLSKAELDLLFMRNVDYVYELEKTSANYAILPNILEMALMNFFNKKTPRALRKQIKSAYRFMDVHDLNGVTVIEGTVDKFYKLYMADKLIYDCSNVLNIIAKNSSCTYLLNGNEASIYDIMKAYEKCQPSELQRYKGLGEMDVEDIMVSTLRPDGERTLIRYTLEDAKEEIEAIRNYESDLSKLLALVGEVKRSDLLD